MPIHSVTKQFMSDTATHLDFSPHVTVATVIEHEGKFLLVQERCHGNIVLNQPAGHLEANETLIQAAVREAYEETGWEIEVTGLLGMNLYRAPANGVTYHRTTFFGKAISQNTEAILDEGILNAIWLSHKELSQRQSEHRSPMVMQAVENYLANRHFPLSMLSDSL